MIIPVDYGQANFKFGGAGQPNGAEVTFGFHNPTALSVTACATAINTAFNSAMVPSLPQQVTWLSTLVKLGDNATGPAVEVATSVAGTGFSDQVQPNMAILVQKRTNLGGRHGRGRFFWPCTEGEVVSGGALVTGRVGSMNTSAATFFSDMATADLPLYLLHADTVFAPTQIQVLATQAIAATQRRRLRR